eukprot:4906439-Prymnesium_polylepis.1
MGYPWDALDGVQRAALVANVLSTPHAGLSVSGARSPWGAIWDRWSTEAAPVRCPSFCCWSCQPPFDSPELAALGGADA